MDGKMKSFIFFWEIIFLLYDRMTINEFKLAYPQINPNINLYTIDLDAERRNFSFLLLYLFFSFGL